MAVHDTLPGNYVRPESQRPRLAEVVTGARIIPAVDLACPDRAAVVAAIGDACRSHGAFFQVVNHGIDGSLIAAVLAVGRDFLRLPAAEKEKAKLYSDFISTYCNEVQELGFRLCAEMSDSLGLDATYMKQTLGEPEQRVAVNLYPEPELTSGGLPVPAHTDPDALTILLTDQDVVAGLQVLHGGKWLAINPRPGALVVSIGDQLRALAKRSRGLSSTDDAAVFQREPGARPRLGEDPDGIVSVHALLCYSDGLVLSLENIIAARETFVRSSPDGVLVQVRVGEPVSVGAEAGDPIVLGLGGVGAKATGEDDGRNNGRRGSRENLLGILGIMAASLAVAAAVPAAVGATTDVSMAFGSALLMFTGVSMVMASIRGA